MLKNLRKLFLAIVMGNALLQVTKAENNPVSSDTQNEELKKQEATNSAELSQPRFVPLTAEEVAEFRKNCTAEDNEKLEKFAEVLRAMFENFKTTTEFNKVEEMCNSYGLSLQIMLSIIPCKVDNQVDLTQAELLAGN
jgi:hypothetical protein